jgi:hypothetical protein
VAATIDAMTEPPHRAVITRLSADFAAISQQLARVSVDLTELDNLMSERPVPSQAAQYVPPAAPYWPQYPPQYPPQHPAQYPAPIAPQAVPRQPAPPPVRSVTHPTP